MSDIANCSVVNDARVRWEVVGGTEVMNELKSSAFMYKNVSLFALEGMDVEE